MSVDMDKLNSFIGRFVGDLGAAVHTGMVVIGECHRREARFVQVVGCAAHDLCRAGSQDEHGRTLRA